MSTAEHETVWAMLDRHLEIKRTIEDLPNGVKTTTTTARPELVGVIRAHVRQMATHLQENRPVRLWDPAFRDIFDHARDVKLKIEDVDGGVMVTETSDNPQVVPMISAHARAVNRFVSEGHAAVRPPWAGGRR